MKLLEKFYSLEKYEKYAVVVLLAAIIMRFTLASIYAVSGDACWHLSVSRFIGENFSVPLFENLGRDSVFSRPPLFHLIAGFFYSVFGIFGDGAAELGMRMVSPMFGSLTLVLFYIFSRKYFSRKISFMSLVVLAFFPLHMQYSALSYTDSTLAFFFLLSIYLAAQKRFLWSAVSSGLTALLKYEGILVIPLVLLIAFYHNKDDLDSFFKKSSLIVIISGIIYSPLLIRNYLLLGNPFWPFLNGIFGGYETVESTYQSFSLFNIFDLANLVSPYLEIFGVPNGNYRLFFYFDAPFIGVFVAGWVLATLAYFSFFVGGILKCDKKRPENIFLFSWIGLSIVLLAGTIIAADLPLGRYLISALPAISIFFGMGLASVLRNKNAKKYVLTFLAVTLAGFVVAEYGKAFASSASWEKYEKDFTWIKENTGSGSTIFFVGQCLAYKTDRYTAYPVAPVTGEYLIPGEAQELEEPYVWVNQDFESEPQSILPDEVVDKIREDYTLVYTNNKTGTEIYKVTR